MNKKGFKGKHYHKIQVTLTYNSNLIQNKEQCNSKF